MIGNVGEFNPFLLFGYISEEYFCDREEETDVIVSALANGRNMTLVSPRRMGKTGLIRHVFNRVEKEMGTRCYYVDLYQTDSLESLVKKLGMAVLGTLDSRKKKVQKLIGTMFKSLRPTLSFDAMTGDPAFSVDVHPEMAEKSLEEILGYMENSGMLCYVAFDEFQEVASYKDKRVEAMLRSYIQGLTNVRFIFSGSQRHVLENMFVSASRPFYQSTQMMHLGCIGKDIYMEFASRLLTRNKQSISADAFDFLYDKVHGHTWYVQYILNRIYESKVKCIRKEDVEVLFDSVIKSNEVTFQTFLRIITPVQGSILKAIAKEGCVKGVQGQTFRVKYHLSAASSIKSAVGAMVEKEFLLDTPDGYEVYDRFFAIWLAKYC